MLTMPKESIVRFNAKGEINSVKHTKTITAEKVTRPFTEAVLAMFGTTPEQIVGDITSQKEVAT
ncbi:MAG: hypothetical protein BWY46_01397 [Firmicutes bacterium ADurb.Bin300]|nr:MAG: hypothetical protein BWY46_01397 [Firmicutes bacterium ADurb.Bin300]